MMKPHRLVARSDWRRTEKGLSILIGHDDRQARDYIAKGVLGGGFV
jgi:hypothetical protein